MHIFSRAPRHIQINMRKWYISSCWLVMCAKGKLPKPFACAEQRIIKYTHAYTRPMLGCFTRNFHMAIERTHWCDELAQWFVDQKLSGAVLSHLWEIQLVMLRLFNGKFWKLCDVTNFLSFLCVRTVFARPARPGFIFLHVQWKYNNAQIKSGALCTVDWLRCRVKLAWVSARCYPTLQSSP